MYDFHGAIGQYIIYLSLLQLTMHFILRSTIFAHA
jgi:hypothetical protein